MAFIIVHMRLPSPLPEPYDADTFRTREASAAGVTRGRLRSGDLWTPHRGVRAHSEATCVEEAATAAALAIDVPFAFSHMTAARLHGMPLPWRWAPDEPVHVITRGAGMHLARSGIVSHRGLERRGLVALPSGLLSTDDLHTWADMAASLSVDPLIELGDWIVRPRSVRGVTDLRSVLIPRKRGVVRARQALEEIRAGSASPMETRARLMLVRGGLPEPELNVMVTDDRGNWLGISDFYWRRWRVVGEYDSRRHVEREAEWERDIARERAYRDADHEYVRLVSRNVNGAHPDAVQIVARALWRRGWRPDQ